MNAAVAALARNAAWVLVVNLTAVLAFLLLAMGDAETLGFVLAGGVVVASWYAGRALPTGAYASSRAVVACGLVAAWVRVDGAHDVPIALTGLAVLMATLLESTVRRLVVATDVAMNLPGYRLAPVPRFDGGRAFRLSLLLTLLLGAAAAMEVPAWPIAGAALAASALSGAFMLVDAVRAQRHVSRRSAMVREGLQKFQPRFYVYFSGPAGSEYQVTMWLPYLERVGEPFAVVLRERRALAALSKVTSAPVVVCSTLASLDNVVVPSLRAAFYVNNGMKNTHFVRFSHLTHVQLLHGDSDKPPSYSPVTALYDRVFVAGQAGRDRYRTHGVDIPDHKFVIVGRPQVQAITDVEPAGMLRERHHVLYAPTWRGHYADTDFSSLPIALELVQGLLRHGATVMFRPHPYSARHPESAATIAEVEALLAADREESGRQHLWGTSVSGDVSLFECFDRTDALLSDVSSVVSDYLYTGKPFAVADMLEEGEGFPRTFPLARGAYVIRRDLSNLDESLTRLLRRDPAAATRAELRTYYLGPFPPGTYSEAFIEAARELVRAPHQDTEATVHSPEVDSAEPDEPVVAALAEGGD